MTPHGYAGDCSDLTNMASRQKQPGLSEAKRNAEALFETKNIGDIREIESRTRKDIEQKKLQLRTLVGDSYKDLIENADKIVSIARNSETVLANIRSIQDSFSSMAHSFATADALLNEKRDSLTKHEELYAVGSRIKYLVDTPELIWGCLDSHEYLEAARRYLRAEQVHAALKSNFPPAMLAKFPLLRHHWPTVTKFKKQIIDAAQASLARERVLSSAAAADAAAAVAALQGLDTAGTLSIFLTGRRAWLQGHLDACASITQPEEVSQALCELSHAVQLAVSQMGELFLATNLTPGAAPKAPDATCRLQAAAREDDVDASELLFGGRSGQPAAGSASVGGAGIASSSPEMDAWRKASRCIVERLTALSSGQVEAACMAWLREVSADASQRCQALLRCCDSAGALVRVEAEVRQSIATWQHPALSAAKGTRGAMLGMNVSANRQRIGALPLPGPPPGYAGVVGVTHGSSLGSGLMDEMALVPVAHLESWEAACEWVLGRPLNLWQDVFYIAFVTRAKELLANAFAAVATAVEEPLCTALQQAAAAAPEPAGAVSARQWPQGMSPAEAALLGSVASAAVPAGSGMLLSPAGLGAVDALMSHAERLGSGAAASSSRQGVGSDKAYRQAVHVILHRCDAQLLAILQAVHQLVGGPDPLSFISSSPSFTGAGPTGSLANQRSLLAQLAVKRDMAGARAADLEPFVQAQCAELAAALASMLQGKLAIVAAAREGMAGASAVEQVLLIGRLASALGSDSRYLGVVMGPPEGWRTALTQAGLAARGGLAAARPSARSPGLTNVRMQAVDERFRGVAVQAYRTWASWAAGCMSSELQASMLADTLLASTAVPRSWQETVIAGSGADAPSELDLLGSGMGGGGAEMRFHLPASPSCGVLQYLMGGCQEVKRAGDHRIAPEALAVLEWELAGAALKRYATLLAPGGALDARLSEKGILQLLLDLRFLRDVLAGGRPLADITASALAAGAVAGSSAAHMPGSGAGLADLQDPAVAAAQAARKREGVSLESALQDRLDPIDWATYEPYLWSNVQKYYSRVGVLFGSLVQLQRVHPDAPSRVMASVHDSNPLNVLPVASRFQYLPISAPIGGVHASSSSNSMLSAAGGSAPGHGAAGNAPARRTGSLGMHPPLSMSRMDSGAVGAKDLAASYSFADLSSGRGASSAAAVNASAADAGAGAGSNAFMARLQAGPSALGTLGSMLGDKATEIGSLAQQKFEDFLPMSALGSAGGLLSTFAKNVVKK